MQTYQAKNEKPVNVLLVDQGLSFGGSLVVLLTIARNLGPDYNPIVVTAIDKNGLSSIDKGEIPVYSCSPSYTYISQFRSRSYAKKIPTNLLKKIYVYYSSVKGFFLNLKYSINIYHMIIGHRVNVVHINGSVFVALAAAIARVQCVWHIHGVPGESRSLWMKILNPWIGKYLSISNYVTAAAVSHRFPKRKLVTLHNPVSDTFIGRRHQNMEDFSNEVRHRLGVGKDDFLVAVFGRIIKWKGQLNVLRAFLNLLDRPDIKLMLVGDASEGFGQSYKDEIETFIEENELQDRVILTGFVNGVYAHYQAADLVVHASIAPEPFGLVVIEAMASGKPIIVSDLGATPELVDEGKDGLVIDPTDSALMAASIRALADDRERCASMGRAGLEKVQKRFLPGQYGVAIARIYQELLNKDSGSK